jgi:hypothetical protein
MQTALEKYGGEDICFVVLDFMRVVQKVKERDGLSKKMYVMENMRFYFGKESFVRYEPFLNVLIDSLKYMANNKSMLDGLKKKDCCIFCL